MPSRLSLKTARQLLNFAGESGVISAAVAEEQLQGAVAIHNMLVDNDVAYLADEVGMGKTYVALGAIALFKHFHPHFRVLVIAPRENIQKKWIRDWGFFVDKLVTVEDLRVKGIGGRPARSLVKADTLVDLVAETSNDPDRDFIMRLTSFSISAAGSDEGRRNRHNTLLQALPWLPKERLTTSDKDRYARNFGRAVNCALPQFDLVVVDEAHNLKAGWRDQRGSIRNTTVGCAIGGRTVDDDFANQLRGYSSRAKRVLLLSATPMETNVLQIWNQLDLLGVAADWDKLKDPELSSDEHRAELKRLLIRRTATLRSADAMLTKTQYRREWRAGGVDDHDEPMRVTSAREKLAVALVQKKVAEIIGSGKHNHSFQVGLLASFESFLETVGSDIKRNAPVVSDGPEGEDDSEPSLFFDGTARTENDEDLQRDGVDVQAINNIARNHQRLFKREMPHPKMDAIVNEVAQSFTTGRKALVFVRRIASVDELQRKLEEKYNEILYEKVRKTFGDSPLRQEFDAQIRRYEIERAKGRHKLRSGHATPGRAVEAEETSSVESFFAWFFRGTGPSGVRSGASLATQLDKASGNYSTLFEDNHVAALLETAPSDVPTALSQVCGLSRAEVNEKVGRLAYRRLDGTSRQQRRDQLHAFQIAALHVLREHSAIYRDRANCVLEEVYSHWTERNARDAIAPDVDRWLCSTTLFTELRTKPELRAALWPEPLSVGFRERLRERERRRELMAIMMRKGHPMIDLFVLIAKRVGTLRLRARESGTDDPQTVATQILELLERQRDGDPTLFNSYYELSQAAGNLNVISQLNALKVFNKEPMSAPREYGTLLRAQRPVAGMARKVNSAIVRQFRMPGYPLVLISTDLLKEGEDLHTFCSNVYHYGIAWMPSGLEQRVGRVDRVGSQTERRLLALQAEAPPEDLLQVYYPHLAETVESLQLRRVYERLNRFLRVMHEGLGTPPKESSTIYVAEESLRRHHESAVIKEPLRSAFQISERMLRGRSRSLAATQRQAASLRSRFAALQSVLKQRSADPVDLAAPDCIHGEVKIGVRRQPFTLLLRSLQGRAIVRCISPVGLFGSDDWDDEQAASLMRAPFTRLSLEFDDKFEAYDIAVEGDVVLGARVFDAERVRSLLHDVTETADRIECELLRKDLALAEAQEDLKREPSIAR